ncbi:RHS repeat-associated core domain-containing protein, partial [Pseudomarimonas arenosa]
RSDHSPPSRFQLRRGTDYFSRDSLRTTRRWIQRYLHAPSGELLAETAPNTNTDDGAIASVYVYFAGQPVAAIRNGAVHYVYNDHLGRPEVVANSANQPVWRAKNYAFHREVMQEGGSFGALNLGFPGQYYDPETNLYYNWHRYYDPSTGRYTQADPIGLAGGLNTYAYVRGNPVTLIDPAGLAPGDCYPDQDVAAANAINDINYQSIKQNSEYAGRIYSNPNGTFSYTAPARGTVSSSNPGPITPRTVGDYHTHGGPDPRFNSEVFSPSDISGISSDATGISGYAGYVGTPRGVIKKFDPATGKVKNLPYPAAKNGDACSCK